MVHVKVTSDATCLFVMFSSGRTVDLIAYGDESVRRSGLSEPVYLLGAWVRDRKGADLADQLSVYVRQGGKLHWRDHVPRTKRKVCQTVAAVGARHLAAIARPLPESGG